ncbi:RICIN domain-containing protein [Streptomyces sp. FZ201]|uniref:RICIN domain-containing protein n=1 Tax=Streptomyces sp. FZ201 TaxID=3057122 RepID=UPI0021C1E298|nr:RICIN domain-containing protein [Streptomyces sp. FZ201]
MRDAGSPNSAGNARSIELTDAQLSAELKKWTGASPALQPVGELLDRHWAAGFAYARLCTSSARAAGMLTTAAFTRLFGQTLRQNGPTSAWRPQLLLTVRRVAEEWDTDQQRELLHPELRSDPAHGERATARLLPPAHRRLLSGAFQRLPQSARCLLWHTEVEAEPLPIPAALLGLDMEGALVELGRARDRLREECLQVHQELAPDQECRRYLRLLDVTYRRGGIDIDPDLRTHLEGCRHCLETADQLHCFNHGLGLALAEAVLGWGAREYVESRALSVDEESLPEEAAPPLVGEDFGADPLPEAPPAAAPPPARSRSARKAARRAVRRRNATVGAVTVGALVLVPLVLWSANGSEDGTAPAGSSRPTEAAGSDGATPTPSPSWAGAKEAAKGRLTGRLHNLASGLCVSVVGGKVVKGAETELAECSARAEQQWVYETDGRLRSAAEPDLCLDSRLGYSVRLAPCTDTRRVRYDFTLQGTLVPRWDQDLALSPAATDGSGALVLKTRRDDGAQRWVVDTSRPELQMEAVNWGEPTSGSPTPSPTPESTPGPKASKSPKTTATPSPTPTPSAEDPCATNPYQCSWGDDWDRDDDDWGDDDGWGGGYGRGRR